MKKKIAVFTTGWGSEILSQFLTGMRQELSGEKTDIFLFLCYATYSDTPAARQGELNIFNLPDLHDFGGVVIFGSSLDYKDRVDQIIERSKEAGIPVVLQGTRREGVSFAGSDNYQAVKDLCDHMVKEHGVKNITFFAGTRDSHDSELRLNSVRDYLKENGCEDYLKEVFYTNWENAEATRRITEICTSGEKLPDVFICANDGLAMETCMTLNRFGYDVPGDVSVTGFDYIDAGKIFDPAIASVDQCFDEMGAASVRLLRQSWSGRNGISEIVPCRFIPGESCNCYDFRNSDLLRRRMGRDIYAKRAMTTYFERKLNNIDFTIMSCLSYLELKDRLYNLLMENHDYEGDSFHILLEPKFGLSIYDADLGLDTEGYSKKMEVIYSMEDGVAYQKDTFDSRDLVPGYDPDGANHLYVFLPLHESDLNYGYLIFRDCFEKIENHFLLTYYMRMVLAFQKFRQALTMDHINKRLLDLMGHDPLTNVNNRMAYEGKQKELQAQIESDPNAEFGIVMFDVNNLKMINDSQGHDAGDEYLIRSCRLICDVFKHSPVYRIGGDEFIAVLSGEDYANRDANIEKINEKMSAYSDIPPFTDDYISIACGLSVYAPDTDMSVADVIKRADEAMYKDKAAKKSHKG